MEGDKGDKKDRPNSHAGKSNDKLPANLWAQVENSLLPLENNLSGSNNNGGAQIALNTLIPLPPGPTTNSNNNLSAVEKLNNLLDSEQFPSNQTNKNTNTNNPQIQISTQQQQQSQTNNSNNYSKNLLTPSQQQQIQNISQTQTQTNSNSNSKQQIPHLTLLSSIDQPTQMQRANTQTQPSSLLLSGSPNSTNMNATNANTSSSSDSNNGEQILECPVCGGK